MRGTLHLDDEILCALVDGELTEAEQRAALDHQQVCEPCRARAQALGGVADVLRCSAPVGPGAPGGEALDAMVAAALAQLPDEGAEDDHEMAAWDTTEVVSLRAVRHRRSHLLSAAVSVAAVLGGVGIAFAAFGHPAQPPVTTGATGLASSLGTFSDTASLSPTLRAEIESLAPGASGQNLPCHVKAAASADHLSGSPSAFSAPLTYGGIPAQVFVYRTPETWAEGSAGGAAGGKSTGSTGGESQDVAVAVVVRDRDCAPLAHLDW
jgi:hypothetical protein